MNKLTPLQRINRVQRFYYSRGQNRENVNNIIRKLLKQKNDIKQPTEK
jgi:hypothetical protein